MLPESIPFSDDTTIKSSVLRGSLENINFLMEKLEAELESVLGGNNNKGSCNIALALLKIINDTSNSAVCSLAADILLELLGKPHSDSYKLLILPENYRKTFKILQQVFCQVFKEKWHSNGCRDIHLKLLKILDCLQTKRPRYQYSCVLEQDVIFIDQMLFQYRNYKEHTQILLNLSRQICRTKQFCVFLGKKSFFDSLALATMYTHEYESAIKIIRCMYKCPEALVEMKTSDNMVLLLSSLININVGTTIIKRQLIAVLYKIAKKAPEKMTNSAVSNNLLEYFKSSNKRSEKRLHMSVIKIYTLLNLACDRKIIPTTSLAYDPNLSQEFDESHKNTVHEDSENDNDYSDEEDDDEYNGNSNQESDSSDEESNDESEESEDEITINAEKENDSCCMSKFYCELNDTTETQEGTLFIHLEKNSSNRESVKPTVRRGQYIEMHAYPDEIGAEADVFGDNSVIIPDINDIDVPHLVKRLKVLRNSNFKIVYDLDNLLQNSNNNFLPSECCFKVNHNIDFSNSLMFESRFESGNLRTAQQVGEYEYDLFLTPDIYSYKGRQWFYFQVSNMVAKISYTFNIVNFDKINSQFNYGMQPVMFSTKSYLLNGSGWKRVGEKIVYYGNHYTNEDHSKQYRSLMFTLKFNYDNDKCYLAYHYPYTYTRLMSELYYLTRALKRDVYVRVDNLCCSVKNNPIPLVTVTSKSSSVSFEKKPIVFLAARVHPGESNSSWIMNGILKCLLDENDNAAAIARHHYIFKIIPMLNPEGVIFGNTRSGLNGCDLNRCWKNPSKYLHPEIYYTKKLVEYAKKRLNHPIFAFIDIHGHSRKKNFFFYGCNPHLSWNKMDKLCTATANFQAIPDAVAFDENMKSSSCQYKIDKKKESTCRVVMWREFGIQNSLTLECSYCSGENKKKMTTAMLQNIGWNLVTALANLALAHESLPASN